MLKIRNLKKKIKIYLEFILQFSLDDFKNKYAGSVLGVSWAFLQPMLVIFIYWFVFQFGFRSRPVENLPFILWLISGLISWFFISDSITNATGSMIEYNYLVKKVLFNVSILPFVKVLSVLFVHSFLLLFTIVVFCIFGYWPDLYYLQLFYYMLYMVILVSGISYLTAALYVFFKDLMQIISILLQLSFWMSPFVWDFSILSEGLQNLLKLNPMYYIVTGYRNIFVYKIGFWEDWTSVLYYWVVALLVLFLGIRTFSKLKPHFADVL